jgi:hypothetical protein
LVRTCKCLALCDTHESNVNAGVRRGAADDTRTHQKAT